MTIIFCQIYLLHKLTKICKIRIYILKKRGYLYVQPSPQISTLITIPINIVIENFYKYNKKKAQPHDHHFLSNLFAPQAHKKLQIRTYIFFFKKKVPLACPTTLPINMVIENINKSPSIWS